MEGAQRARSCISEESRRSHESFTQLLMADRNESQTIRLPIHYSVERNLLKFKQT